MRAFVPAALTCAALAVFASPALARSTEFNDPSSTTLPAPNAYNTTPSCPLNAGNSWNCSVPESDWPLSDADNPEDNPGPNFLNSAYWPAEKRPDVEMFAIQSYGYGYHDCTANLVHYCFVADARAVGYPITHTPQVGDLWVAPGQCLAGKANRWGGDESTIPASAGCSDSRHDWYMGYVEKVLPGGGFIQSWGGSDTAADSGLALTQFTGAMDPYTDFIGFIAKSKLHRLDRINFTVQVQGHYAGFAIWSDAPDPVLHVTGTRSFTAKLPNRKTGIDRTLPRGHYRACGVSGGPGTSFARGQVCKRFTVK